MKILKNEIHKCKDAVEKIAPCFNNIIKENYLFFPLETKDYEQKQDDFVVLTETKNNFGYSNLTKPGLLLLDDEVKLAYVTLDCQANIDMTIFANIISEFKDFSDSVKEAFVVLEDKDANIVKQSAIVAAFKI